MGKNSQPYSKTCLSLNPSDSLKLKTSSAISIKLMCLPICGAGRITMSYSYKSL